MSRVGREVLAHWRETGAWWEGEVATERTRYRDVKGVVREDVRTTPIQYPVAQGTLEALKENIRNEDLALRPRKTRDEKVRKACGLIPPAHTITAEGGNVPMAFLHGVSGYSFGRSILFATEIPNRAAFAGYEAALIADMFSFAGVVEFARQCRDCGIKPLIGVTVEMPEGGELVLIARTQRGFQNLSHLITQCHLSHPRLFPLCNWELLEQYREDVLCLTGGSAGLVERHAVRGDLAEAQSLLNRLVGLYGQQSVFVELERCFEPWTIQLENRMAELAREVGVRCVAGGPATHGSRRQFPAQDIALCSQTLALVEEVIGRKPQRHPDQPKAQPRPLRALNAERFIRSTSAMGKLFSDFPEVLTNTLLLAERCDAHVLPERTQLPPQAEDEPAALYRAIFEGSKLRHKKQPANLTRRLLMEWERIVKMGFAGHFLVAWDLCNWANEQGILFSGRGSVVDSAVAYCLGLSRIDAFEHRLHFDRFLPTDGSKRPDIDLDFEAFRRDDVRLYLTRKYGTDNVAMVCAFGAYNTRGIVREVCKALAFDDKTTGFIAKRVHGGVDPERLAAALNDRPELRDSPISIERLDWVFRLSALLADVPRNIRSHSSGLVISSHPIADTVPVQWSAAEVDGENVRIIQWDKRSAKHYFDKFDLLCLRGQDALSGAQQRIRLSEPEFTVEQVSLKDEHTYEAMRSGDLIGIPQSASPAMRQAHMRIRTRNLTDASLVQAGIRPGVGGAVKLNEMIARRRGKSYAFDHPDFELILGNTYGIVVFQEQVDQLLQRFCGCSSGEAEELREEIHKRRREDYGQVLRPQLVERAMRRGYPIGVAEQAVDMVAAFRGYGFAQGHALAFAEISVRSIFCQQNYPAQYFAALLDAQPAGYYGPCTLVNEARWRGVRILPVDVNKSTRKHEVEHVYAEGPRQLLLPHGGIRLSLDNVDGLSKSVMDQIIALRPFSDIYDFVQRVELKSDELEDLILCGALDTLHPNRRALLFMVRPLLDWRKMHWGDLGMEAPPPPLPDVPDFCREEKAVRERSILGLDIHHHLVGFERERISSRGGITAQSAQTASDGSKVLVVGNPIRLRFPPTPSGKRVVFFDLEDETGLLNVTCFDAVYQRDGHAIVCSPYVAIVARVQRRQDHAAFLAQRVFAYQPEIVQRIDSNEPLPLVTADFLVG